MQLIQSLAVVLTITHLAKRKVTHPLVWVIAPAVSWMMTPALLHSIGSSIGLPDGAGVMVLLGILVVIAAVAVVGWRQFAHQRDAVLPKQPNDTSRKRTQSRL